MLLLVYSKTSAFFGRSVMLLAELLARPARQGMATLVLIDETLMFVREKVGLDPIWRGRLINFSQYLTQAATKVDSCGIVASLLATDPHKSDTLGKELTQECACHRPSLVCDCGYTDSAKHRPCCY